MAVWNEMENVLIVLGEELLDDFDEIKTVLKKFDINIHSTVFLSNQMNDAKVINKNGLYVTTKKSFNFLGKLKDENLKKILNSPLDTLIVLGDISKNNKKLIRKRSFKRKIGVNSNCSDLSINLKTEKKEPREILSFVHSTLNQIQ